MASQSAQALPSQNPKSSVADQCLHKSRLHHYTQKSTLPAPIYHTVMDGVPHGPKFVSTVTVDGVTYKSQPCRHRKEAEQDAARIALDDIMKKINERGCTILYEDISCCKSILYEFAVKMSLELPTYTTTRSEGRFPIFISTLVFHGKTYTGVRGRGKKEAEQFGARSVIQSILGTDSGPHLSEIINAKRKLYDDAVRKASGKSVMPIVPCPENSVEVKNAPETLPDVRAFKKPKLEPECETSTGSMLDQPPCADQAGLTGVQGTTSSSKGRKNPRKKNKKKGQTELQTDGRLPIIQPSPCSVAQ